MRTRVEPEIGQFRLGKVNVRSAYEGGGGGVDFGRAWVEMVEDPANGDEGGNMNDITSGAGAGMMPCLPHGRFIFYDGGNDSEPLKFEPSN